MTRKPKRRSSNRPAFDGDFDDDQAVTQLLAALPPAETWHNIGPRGELHDQPAPQLGQRPAITLAGQQAPWAMTVNPRQPGDPPPSPQGVKAAVYLETEADVLKDDGKLYDADASDAICRKAARRLRGARRPWEPGEEHQRELARIFGGDVA